MTESCLMMLLLSHFAAIFFMTGVIWFVQSAPALETVVP